MTSDTPETLRWQFGLTWRLAQVHLPALSDETCLWEPTPHSWSVRRVSDGSWRSDWADSEPDPAPTVTIGWLTWHIIWWWSGLIAVVREEAPPRPQEVYWPGSADGVRRQLEGLHTEWTEILFGLSTDDLERPLAYPWPEPRPLRYALAWCNSELMKNVAELGYVRLLFESSRFHS
jgi:hypothetical protein